MWMGLQIHVKAPGKVLWLGGYSVLEKPGISFVTTIDSFVHAYVKTTQYRGKVAIKAPHMKRATTFTLDERTHMLEGTADPGLEILKHAVGVALMFLRAYGAPDIGIQVRTENDPAMSYAIDGEGEARKVSKRGLGSSSAVTVAAIAGVLQAAGADAPPELVHKLAQLSHSIATGKVGSGFDIAAATFGSIVYERYSPEVIRKAIEAGITPDTVFALTKADWGFKARKVRLPDVFSSAFAGFANGGASTSSMVRNVLAFKDKFPKRYWELVSGIDTANVAAISALERINKGSALEENASAFRNSFEEGRLLTKRLGEESNTPIEPDDCSKLIDESVSNGAFVAKLPGAGGRDMIAALSTSPAERAKLLKYWSSNPLLESVAVAINNGGFQNLNILEV